MLLGTAQKTAVLLEQKEVTQHKTAVVCRSQERQTFGTTSPRDQLGNGMPQTTVFGLPFCPIARALRFLNGSKNRIKFLVLSVCGRTI